ncbi:DUF5753 domain-containing protein [Thermomonospora echinospora]|nr:DUF5753 domain-containing protein [Thermomonospora echinospora]
MAKIMNCTKGTVSNLEHARPGYRLDERQAKAIDEYFGLGVHFQRMVRYAKSGHDPDWSRQHTLYEQRALTIRTYEAMVVPGLLQTEDYARALLTAGYADDVETWVKRRMSRQAVLAKSDRPHLWVIISQNVLDWPVGGAAVMAAQLARLLEISEMPNVTLRVLPRSVGAHLGLEGTFKIVSVKEGDVVYMEACGGGRLTQDLTDVRKYHVRYDRIGADALPRNSSRDLIRRAMETYHDAVAQEQP